jgi:RNA polymerase sigma factor (sigma-70 family)
MDRASPVAIMADEHVPTPAQREFAERLFREHGGRLRAIAQRHGLRASDADEAVQHAMIMALKANPGMEEPVAWATVVVKREAWRIVRRRERRAEPPPTPDEGERPNPLEILPSPGRTVQETAERSEYVDAFRVALDALKPQERQVLLLLGAGFSYREIGARTGFTHTKINRCVAEGRATLRQHVARWEREGNRGLEDVNRLAVLRREPTAMLVGRRHRLLGAGRHQADQEASPEERDRWLRKQREKLQTARARRRALEADPAADETELKDARSSERRAEQELRRIGGERSAQSLRSAREAQRKEALAEIDAELGRRRQAIVANAERSQPAYVREALGPRPAEERARASWRRALAGLVAVRQRHGITNQDRALGEDPPSAARRRLDAICRSLRRENERSVRGPELGL